MNGPINLYGQCGWNVKYQGFGAKDISSWISFIPRLLMSPFPILKMPFQGCRRVILFEVFVFVLGKRHLMTSSNSNKLDVKNCISKQERISMACMTFLSSYFDINFFFFDRKEAENVMVKAQGVMIITIFLQTFLFFFSFLFLCHIFLPSQ